MKQQHEVVRELANLKSQSMVDLFRFFCHAFKAHILKVSRVESEFRAALEALIEERVAQYFGRLHVDETIMEEEDHVSVASSLTIEEALDAVNQIFEEVRQQQQQLSALPAMMGALQSPIASHSTPLTVTSAATTPSSRTRTPSVETVPSSAQENTVPIAAVETEEQRSDAELQNFMLEVENRRFARFQEERRVRNSHLFCACSETCSFWFQNELSGLSSQGVVSTAQRRAVFLRPRTQAATQERTETLASSEIRFGPQVPLSTDLSMHAAPCETAVWCRESTRPSAANSKTFSAVAPWSTEPKVYPSPLPPPKKLSV